MIRTDIIRIRDFRCSLRRFFCVAKMNWVSLCIDFGIFIRVEGTQVREEIQELENRRVGKVNGDSIGHVENSR